VTIPKGRHNTASASTDSAGSGYLRDSMANMRLSDRDNDRNNSNSNKSREVLITFVAPSLNNITINAVCDTCSGSRCVTSG
jgi:hypothetical protein